MSWLLLYLRLSSAAIAATEIHYQKLDPSLWLERTPTSAFIAYCVHIFFGVANLFLCPCNFTIFSFSFDNKTVSNFKKHTHIGTYDTRYAWPLALAKWKLAGRGEPVCLEGNLMILLKRIHCTTMLWKTFFFRWTRNVAMSLKKERQYNISVL